MRPLACTLALLLVPAPLAAQGPNPTNLFAVSLTWRGDSLVVGPPRKLTKDVGVNSQPSFSPDGRWVVFSGTREVGDSARSDIYRIDLRTGREQRVTRTPEHENSPTVNARGEYLAVRWQPATLFREYGPWVYAANGTPRRALLPGADTTGYYTPLADGRYLLTRPKSRHFTLALFDPKARTIVDVDSGVPALPAVRIPGQRAVSYVRVDSANARHELRRLDLSTMQVTSLGPALGGRTAHVWVRGRDAILMAKGNALYARGAADTAWRRVATFDHVDLQHAAAYVTSPDGRTLILTSPRRVPIAVALRDSLEAGRPVAEALAAIDALRDGTVGWNAGTWDLTEGSLAALVEDRRRGGHHAEVLPLRRWIAALFTNSHTAHERLGDALLAAGDTTGAVAAWRRALEVNSRETAAERAAVERVELRLREQRP